jgi:tRNA threonylcarbamoyladenosine biosynthesis protein TsaE
MAKEKNRRHIRDTNTFKPGHFITKSPDQTRKLGGKFAGMLKKGDIVFLKGDLGSGKTTFTQGITKSFGNKGFARSSSFTLVNEYEAGECRLFHMDLYRLEASTVWDLGIEEYLFSGNIAVIEWPERLLGFQDGNTWHVEIESSGNERKIKIGKRK